MESRCVGCGGFFDSKVGAIHDYMLSSATCWEKYGHILAREYQNQNLFVSSHRLTVDAYGTARRYLLAQASNCPIFQDHLIVEH